MLVLAIEWFRKLTINNARSPPCISRSTCHLFSPNVILFVDLCKAEDIVHHLNRSVYSPYQKWVPRLLPGGEGGRCIWLTALPLSFADCLEIWEPQSPGTLWVFLACNGIALPFTIHTARFNVQKCFVLPIKFIDVFWTVLRKKKTGNNFPLKQLICFITEEGCVYSLILKYISD